MENTIKNKQKQFEKELKNETLTEEMLSLVLFSLNKRAKNKRDKKREYYNITQCSFHNGTRIFHKYLKQYKEQEKELYTMKSNILERLFSPTEYHLINNKLYSFYVIGEYSFHCPYDGDEKTNAKILNNFKTNGHNTETLLSNQFCAKVHDYVVSHNCQTNEKAVA